MAGGQETSSASTYQVGAVNAQDHQGDGTHRGRRRFLAAWRASSPIVRIDSACSASSWKRRSVTPPARKKLLTLPEKIARRPWCSSSRATAGSRAPTTTPRCAPGERLVANSKARARRFDSSAWERRPPRFYRFRGLDVEHSFVGFVDRPTFADAQEIARRRGRPFMSGEAQQVLLVSTRYLSAGSQPVQVEQLLPLVIPELPEPSEPKPLKGYTEFEPEVEKLLFLLMPRALESEIFSALLEGAASFHTSQQRAMAAATDNADELGQTLTRVMNRARQDSITTEIMEIVGGAEALRSGK